MTEKIIKTRKEYNKEFKEKNKNYWKENYEKNKEKRNEYQKQYRYAKKDKKASEMIENMNALKKQIYTDNELKKYSIMYDENNNVYCLKNKFLTCVI